MSQNVLRYFTKSNSILIGLSIIWLVSRLYILTHPPFQVSPENNTTTGYSDVKHDYERYANIWHYGMAPYTEHLFEYPPASLPVIYLPLRLDLAGIGEYYQNYRTTIFLFEFILFGAMVVYLWSQKLSLKEKVGSVSFYILAGLIAHRYWYDGLDLLFIGTFTLGLLVWLQKKSHWLSHSMTWLLMWLSVALKVMTAPLVALYFILRTHRKNLISVASKALITSAIVWGLPLLIYRSSLSVFLIFHANRPLKYGAFGTWIIETINDITQTEMRLDTPPDFAWHGPVSQAITRLFSFAFPIAVIVVLLLGYHYLKKASPAIKKHVFITLCLIYLFVVFITGKTFSSPFHIWYIPLLTLYPFKNYKERLLIFGVALFMVTMDTTEIIPSPTSPFIGPFPLKRARDTFRFIPWFFMVGYFVNQLRTRHEA